MKHVNLETLKRNACPYTNRNMHINHIGYYKLEEIRESYKFNNPNFSVLCDLLFAVLCNIEANWITSGIFNSIICQRNDLKKYYKELIEFAQLELKI